MFNCSRTKFVAFIVSVLVHFFNVNFSLVRFCAFLLELSLTSQVTFFSSRYSFLSDLYCSHTEAKLVAKIKSNPAWQHEGQDSRVGSASGEGEEGQ